MTARFAARNPAFDVTPADLIAAIVTEEGVHRAPYADVAPRAGELAMILDEVDPDSRAILEASRLRRRRRSSGSARASSTGR